MECVVCDQRIDSRTYNPYVDSIPGCCLVCAETVHKRRQKKFTEYLERASQTVTWPKRKQDEGS